MTHHDDPLSPPSPEVLVTTIEEQERISSARLKAVMERQDKLIRDALAKTTACVDVQLTNGRKLHDSVLGHHDVAMKQTLEQLQAMQKVVESKGKIK